MSYFFILVVVCMCVFYAGVHLYVQLCGSMWQPEFEIGMSLSRLCLHELFFHSCVCECVFYAGVHLYEQLCGSMWQPEIEIEMSLSIVCVCVFVCMLPACMYGPCACLVPSKA